MYYSCMTLSSIMNSFWRIIMMTFFKLTSSLTPTIFTWSFYCDFAKIEKNTFATRVSLGILGSLIGESDIENKFISLIREYPEVRKTLPILLAVRDPLQIILNSETKEIEEVGFLFDPSISIDRIWEEKMRVFFRESGLRDILADKKISNLSDYVFGIETGLDSNARKNRSGTMMEHIVEDFVKEFAVSKGYEWKSQATAKWMNEHWWLHVHSDKSERRFDFAIYTGERLYLFETNFYGGGGSKLKAVAGEFSWLYHYLWNQGINLLWITDGLWWNTTLHPLEDAYNATNGNIYNLSMLRDGILSELIK